MEEGADNAQILDDSYEEKISILRARCIGDSIYVEFSDHTSMAFSAKFLHERGELQFPEGCPDIHVVKKKKFNQTQS